MSGCCACPGVCQCAFIQYAVIIVEATTTGAKGHQLLVTMLTAIPFCIHGVGACMPHECMRRRQPNKHIALFVFLLQWELSVWRGNKWRDDVTYLFAVVVIGAVLMTALLFAVLLSW